MESRNTLPVASMGPEELVAMMRGERVRGASWFFNIAVEALRRAGDRLAEVAAMMRGIMPIVDCLVDRVLENRGALDLASSLLGREVECGLFDADSVTTISLSSAVRRCLSTWRPARIYLLESRPGVELDEARRAYSEISEVVVVPDAAMSIAVRRSSAVVVGADLVTPTYLYNKIGSLPLSLTARHFGRPVIAVFEAFKICDKVHVDIPVRGGIEILEGVPLGIITRLITDIGTYEDAASLMKAYRKLVHTQDFSR